MGEWSAQQRPVWASAIGSHGRRRLGSVMAVLLGASLLVPVASGAQDVTAEPDAAPVPDAPAAAEDTPGFTLAVTPTTQLVPVADAAGSGFLVEAPRSGGYDTNVSLTVKSQDGITASVAPATIAPGGHAVVGAKGISTTKPGDYWVDVTAKSGTLPPQTTRVTLRIVDGLVPLCVNPTSGVITDDAGSPVSGAKVQLTAGTLPSTTNKTQTTSPSGGFDFGNVGLGANNKPVTATVTVTPGDVPKVNHIGSHWGTRFTVPLVCGRSPAVSATITRVVPAFLAGRFVEGEVVGGDYTKVTPKVPAVGVKGVTATVATIANVSSGDDGVFRFKDDTGRVGLHLKDQNAPVTGKLSVTLPELPPKQGYWPIDPVAFEQLDPGTDQTLAPVPLVRQCTARFSALVLDSSGQGISGVTLTVRSTDPKINEPVTITSGPGGIFTAADVLVGFNNKPSTMNITATKEGYQPSSRETPVIKCGDNFGGGGEPLSVPLFRTDEVSYSPTSGPLAGGTLVTFTGPNVAGATEARFGGLPGTELVQVSPTEVTVKTPPGTEPGLVDVTLRSNPDGSPALTEYEQQFEYLPVQLYGSVAGRVVDEESGEPLAGVKVLVPDCRRIVTTFDCKVTPSDADGRFTVARVPVGTLPSSQLTITLLSQLATSPPPTHWDNTTGVKVTVKVGDPTTAPDLELLRRKYGDIAGTVRDAADDTPLAAAGISSTARPRIVCGPPCATGPDGSFRLQQVELLAGNKPAKYPVTATMPGYWPKTASGVEVTAGATATADIELVKFCPDGATFRGKVFDGKTGLPIPGAKVTVAVTQVPVASEVVTVGDDGAYEVDHIQGGPDNTVRGVAVKVEAAGFYSRTVTVQAECGDVIDLNFGQRPTVTGLTPASGPTGGGTEVVIRGTNLAGDAVVTFDGVASPTVTPVGPNQLRAVSPAHAPGPVDVVVKIDDLVSETTSASRFTYAEPPSLTAISPNSGPAAGGTTVAITGTNLTGATAVRFGSTPATAFSVLSDSTVRATSPAGNGEVDVVVTTPGGDTPGAAAGRYTYVPPDPDPVAPTVTKVAPSSGPAAGGNEVVITGTEFVGVTGVRFGSAAAVFTVGSATSITATVPAGTGVVHVTVITAAGTSAVSDADRYTYVPPDPDPVAPTVTKVAPSSGPAAGGNEVVITGTEFVGVTGVRFGSAAAVFTVGSATSITATVPAGTGVVHVTVITAAGTSAVSDADRYTYVTPDPDPGPGLPVVTGVTPSSGPEAGGTAVTISGERLRGATKVRFGSATTTFTVLPDGSLRAVTPPGIGTVPIRVTTKQGISDLAGAPTFTYVTACVDGPPASLVTADLTTAAGDSARVSLVRSTSGGRPIWAGFVNYDRASGGDRIWAIGQTSADAVRLLEGSCGGGAIVRVTAYNLNGWVQVGTLELRLRPGATPGTATVAMTFRKIGVAETTARGSLRVE